MAEQRYAAQATKVAHKGVYDSLRVILHLTAAVQFWYAIYYDFMFVEFPTTNKNMHSPFGGKFKFLTFLDAIIQASYFTLCLVNDFVGTNEISPKRMPSIRRAKDYILATFAFPVALNVGISFWTLYAIDRELVFPKALDAVFPSWLNHIMHTNIMIFIILEMCTSARQYPARRKGITGLTTFMLCYLVWIHIVKHYSGFWVYPVLEVLQLPQRIIFFISVLGFTIFLYTLGEYINNVLWAKEQQKSSRRKAN